VTLVLERRLQTSVAHIPCAPRQGGWVCLASRDLALSRRAALGEPLLYCREEAQSLFLHLVVDLGGPVLRPWPTS
jgi:hypothetical protein